MAEDANDGGKAGGFTDRMFDPARAGEAMKEQGQKMAQAGSSLGTRMIDQAEANTREAFEAMRKVAQATSPTEVMKVQAEYLRGQGERSMTQAREIGEIIAEFGKMVTGSIKRPS